MELSFKLSSGYLDMDKKTFVKDILLGKSLLRSIIYSNKPGSIPPIIDKGNNRVKIIFDDATDLELGENYEDVFKNLKQKYGSNLQGIIVIHSMPYSAFFSLDLS